MPSASKLEKAGDSHVAIPKRKSGAVAVGEEEEEEEEEDNEEEDVEDKDPPRLNTSRPTSHEMLPDPYVSLNRCADGVKVLERDG